MKKLVVTRSIANALFCMFFYGNLKSMAFSLPRRRGRIESRRLLASTTTTRYTIDTPPIDHELLQSTVYKSLANFDRYLNARPVAAHTRQAFEQFQAELAKDDNGSLATTTPLILDSGCGTGRSSLVLGEKFPHCLVVGVDRSIDRLGRTARDLSSEISDEQQQDEDEPSNDEDTSNRRHVQRVRDNVILVRAELVHFWRLWWQHGLVAEQHYLLYPNPYPKKSRLKQRWYAHPSFPLLLLVSAGNPLILRSNWKQYLQEFADAIVASASLDGDKNSDSARASQVAKKYQATARLGPVLRTPGEAWTNFEQKYDTIGETTFELLLRENEYVN